MSYLVEKEKLEAIYDSEIEEMYSVVDQETGNENIIIGFKRYSTSIIISSQLNPDGTIELVSDFLHGSYKDFRPNQGRKRKKPW